jgi:hypothetical protein
MQYQMRIGCEPQCTPSFCNLIIKLKTHGLHETTPANLPRADSFVGFSAIIPYRRETAASEGIELLSFTKMKQRFPNRKS